MAEILGTIQMRRGNAAEWASVNPTLAPAEFGYELDTGLLKIGNGSLSWNELPYNVGGGGSQAAPQPHPYDMSVVVFDADTARAAGPGDLPFGVRIPRDVDVTRIEFRCATADSGGLLGVAVLLNGVELFSASVAAATQVAGQGFDGAWHIPAGSLLTVAIQSVGTDPGKGLVVDFTGTAP